MDLTFQVPMQYCSLQHRTLFPSQVTSTTDWWFWRMMLLNCGVGEDSWESLELQRDQPLNPKGNQSWIFIGRTDVEAEIPILWPPDVKSWLIGKDPDAGKDWRQEEKGITEDEVVGWYHWLDGPEFEEALGVDDGLGSLVCSSPWGCKDLDMTEWLNWTEKNLYFSL